MIPSRLRSVLVALAALGALALLAGCGVLGGQTTTIISSVGNAVTPGPSIGPASSAAGGACPTSQPAALPAGEKRTVAIDTPKGAITMEIDADLSPIAAGNFVALAECGYYDGVPFHRLVPGFVIQGGEGADLGYTIKDEPVTAKYERGTVAMARTSQPDSVDSQFFIVLDDAAGQVLASYNTYQIIGKVTAGMDVVDAIAAMPNSGDPSNTALDPVPMTKVTVSK